MRARIPGSRCGMIRQALPSVVAITLLCSSSSNAHAGWLADLIQSIFGRNDSSESGAPLVNDGVPVPTIANDDQSADFLLSHLVEEAQENGEDAVEATENYDEYATKLARVISQLSPDEQRVVFYGQL